MLQDQINQVEQRIKNLQRSMNAEMDSLLSQLQHLKQLAASVDPEVSLSKELVKQQSVKTQLNTWEYLPDVLKVNDVQEIMKIGRNQAYTLVKSGQFHCIRLGRRWVVPKQGFIEWLEGINSNQN